MAYRLKWEAGGENRQDCSGSLSELTGTVGLFYIFLICLGLLFVTLKNLQGQDAPVSQPHSPPSALYQALLPFDSGR
jgi:hypothetical protein